MIANYQLFNRYIKISVGPLDIESLHASFTVEKDLSRVANKAELMVYNLNPAHRKAFDSVPSGITPIKINTGYSGFPTIGSVGGSLNVGSSPIVNSLDSSSQIFSGDVVQIFSTKSGPDWITVFRTADGVDADQKSRINTSYKKGHVYKTIALDLIKAYRVSGGKAITKISESQFDSAATSVLSNYTVSGKVNEELHALLTKMKLTGSVQDGELIILGDKEFLGTDAIVLTPDTGLLGSPEYQTNGYVKCRTLVRPEIKPGYQINIQSDAVNGNFRVERVVYTGTTYDNTWYTDIEAKPIT